MSLLSFATCGSAHYPLLRYLVAPPPQRPWFLTIALPWLSHFDPTIPRDRFCLPVAVVRVLRDRPGGAAIGVGALIG